MRRTQKFQTYFWLTKYSHWSYLLQPYPCPGITPQKMRFSYHLSRASQVVERAFGLLDQRFRIFRGWIQCSLETCDSVIKNCLCITQLAEHYQRSPTCCARSLSIRSLLHCVPPAHRLHQKRFFWPFLSCVKLNHFRIFTCYAFFSICSNAMKCVTSCTIRGGARKKLSRRGRRAKHD